MSRMDSSRLQALQRAGRRRSDLRMAMGPGAAHFSPPPPRPWLWAVNTEGAFVFSSPASREMIGYDPDELVGKPASDYMDLSEAARAESAASAVGPLGTEWTGIVISCRHRDGSLVWFDVEGGPRVGSAGELIGFEGSCRPLDPGDAGVLLTKRIRARIRTAITDRALGIAFQPIVELATGRTMAVEALSRFTGPMSRTPDIWFAEAGSVGLGPELELLAIELALTAATQLPDHLSVSLNASPATCLDPMLATLIMHAAIGPSRLVLEVTEHSRVVHYSPLSAALAPLRRQGVQIAIDDAGAGFASFRHVLRLEPDVIKLDQEIISHLDSDPGRRALGAAMVTLAARIGARIVAEGIETVAELKAVTDLGMAAGQGFLLGRPSLDPAEWARWRPQVHSDRLPLAVLTPSATAAGQGTVEARAKAAVRVGGLGAPALLDALPDATAVLDAAGTIVAVNRAWQMFSLDNGGSVASTGVGVSYLEVCRRAAAAGDSDAAGALADLRSVLGGKMVESKREYPCDSPEASRWFISRVTSIPGGAGAVASHYNISRRKRSELELVNRATHDPLTGLANRLLFTRWLSDVVAREPRPDRVGAVGLLYLSLDKIREVNDRLGFGAGDEFLLQVTHRLRVAVRPWDFIGRLSGGEFAICIPGTTHPGLICAAQRLQQAMAVTHLFHGRPIPLGGPIGSYLLTPDVSAALAMRHAEQAMYMARSAPESAEMPGPWNPVAAGA